MCLRDSVLLSVCFCMRLYSFANFHNVPVDECLCSSCKCKGILLSLEVCPHVINGTILYFSSLTKINLVICGFHVFVAFIVTMAQPMRVMLVCSKFNSVCYQQNTMLM